MQAESPMSVEMPIIEEDEDEENDQNKTRSNKINVCYKKPEPVNSKLEKTNA